MSNCLLSLIVPVYNAENYIESCLDSILSCEFQNLIEIILIDDGSTDHSLELMKTYQQKDLNGIIKVISQENKGAGETRNRGLKESNGLYIWFVDSDDRINWKGFDSLISLLQKENLDIVLFNFLLLYSSGKLERYGLFDLDTSDIKSGIKLFTEKRIYPSPWNKIFRREFLTQNDLWFVPDLLPEDMELMTRCFLHAKRVKCVALDLYYWHITPNSLSKRSTMKYLEGYIRTLNSHFDLACKYPFASFWIKDFVYIIYELNNKIVSSGELTYLSKEKEIVRKIIRQIPVICSKEYLILLSISINPYLFFYLKRLKH